MEKFIQFEVFQEVYPDLNSNEALDKLSKVKSLKINM